MKSALYVVATPIGNLEDLTPRAAEVLGGVDTVYAEDTRRTGILLDRTGLRARLRSLHEHNEAARTEEILERLAAGARLAVVSDAGTPGVSDPGRRVVDRVLESDLPVRAVPGASAVPAALSVSGLPADRYLFLGFPPRRGREREAWMQQLEGSTDTVVVFESPARVAELLGSWVERGLGGRRCTMCRELTKRFEEVRRARVSELAAALEGGEVRGEVTLVLEGGEPTGWETHRARASREARELVGRGASTRDVVRVLRERYEAPRNEAYELALSVAAEVGNADGSAEAGG